MAADVGPAKAAPTCTPGFFGQGCPTPQTPTPTPCFSPDPSTLVECSPSSSPEIIVISPVPQDSPSPYVTPSYLVGIPSPSVDPGVDTGGTPIPLAGGFNDLPSPGPVTAVSDTGNGGGGIPGPLALIGWLLLVGAAGSVLFAIAPRGERFPEPPAHDTHQVLFTPYGADSPELMVMDHGTDTRPWSGGRGPKPSP